MKTIREIADDLCDPLADLLRARYVGIDEAARIIGIHPVTLRQIISEGRMPALRHGHALLVERADAEARAAYYQNLPNKYGPRPLMGADIGVTELAALAGVSRFYVLRAIHRGDIRNAMLDPDTPLYRRWVIDREEGVAWAKARHAR